MTAPSPPPTPSDRTAFKVRSFEVNESLLWAKPDGTWAWRLTPVEDNGTRLVTRIHAVTRGGAHAIRFAALVFSALYFVSDLIEAQQGGFSDFQLRLPSVRW